MSRENHVIKIEDIENAPDKKLQIVFEEEITEIKSKTPISAELELISLGDYIEVKGYVEGTAILECDLCLSEFEYALDFEIDELYSKNTMPDEYGAETELREGQFVTDLQGADSIDIYDLLYQSVILDFPNKKVCGINCKGGDIFIRDENPTEKAIDPRLAVFKDIKVKSKK